MVLSVLICTQERIILVKDLDQQHGLLSYGAGICCIKRMIPVPNSIIRIGSVNDCVGDQIIQISWHIALVDIFSQTTAPNIAVHLFVVVMVMIVLSYCYLHVHTFSSPCM